VEYPRLVCRRSIVDRNLPSRRTMPELPEVERAARRIRRAVSDKVIARVRLLHPALERLVSRRALTSLRGRRVAAVEQRAKHQLLRLDDGRALHVHFRMAGDWALDGVSDDLPRSARAAIEFTDGTRLLLVDPRALSAISLLPKGEDAFAALGPDPSSPDFDAALATALARRRIAVKPALLDQHVAAGVGNIYAAEALWEAMIDPAAPANSLTHAQVAKLAAAIRVVLDRGRAGGRRYREGENRFRVYDREGQPCFRCGTPIERIVQAGRSTCFCPSCQRSPAKRPKRKRTTER
jgi:formamidopyrimidine-DNA glycosylase